MRNGFFRALIARPGRIVASLTLAKTFTPKPVRGRPISGIAFANRRQRKSTPVRAVPSRTGKRCAYWTIIMHHSLAPNKEGPVTPKEVLALCREKDVKAIDLRFMDFPGLWQHFTIPVDKLDEDVFEDGLGFDGSSIRGWQAINESDMLIVPQPDTAVLDPFCKIPTLSMICNIQDPITREDYSRDPRNVARKAVNYLKSTGIGDTCFIGPEAEFFIFDDVRYDQTC